MMLQEDRRPQCNRTDVIELRAKSRELFIRLESGPEFLFSEHPPQGESQLTAAMTILSLPWALSLVLIPKPAFDVGFIHNEYTTLAAPTVYPLHAVTLGLLILTAKNNSLVYTVLVSRRQRIDDGVDVAGRLFFFIPAAMP